MRHQEWAPEFEKVLRPHLPLAGDRQIRPDADLADLGLDSLALVSLLIDVEETFRVTIPDELLMSATFASAGALWQVVVSLSDAPDDSSGDGGR